MSQKASWHDFSWGHNMQEPGPTTPMSETTTSTDTASDAHGDEDSGLGAPEQTDASDASNHIDSQSAEVSDSGDGDAPPAAQATEQPEPPRSPAEAFAELAAQIAQARRDIAQVADYARGTGAQLQRAYDDVFLQGADAAIRGLIRIDELLFKQTRENTSSTMHPQAAAFATLLGQALEGELRSIDVHVLEPQPGDELDLSRMVAIANRPAPLLRGRRAGSIAEVISRGYVYSTPGREQILKKAEVVIWRARDEVAFDGTDEAESDRGVQDE